jgi:hypothetical protein
MPGWHADGREADGWKLVAFIRHLPQQQLMARP